MPAFVFLLRLFAAIVVVVAALHLSLGLRADALLGANVTGAVATEPSLDSQNRFYGVAFALYGVVLYLCASDLRRFEPMFKAAMWVFFLGGVARLVSWASHGAPSPLVVALGASELLLPPVLLAWHARLKRVA